MTTQLTPGTQVLFTRQRHDAKRAGLHYDYRIVVGDLAYSWATKKPMPAQGEAIIFHEQPVHDATYALSKRVEIPDGQYGAGVTTLDYVKKAKLGEMSTPDRLTLHTDTDKFLLKKLDQEKYGKGAWLFRNVTPYQEGPDSTFTHAGKDWLVDKALEVARYKPIRKHKIQDLEWVLEHDTVQPHRLRQANPTIPILVAEHEGKIVVIDGLHRLAKAKELGWNSIPTKMVDVKELGKPVKKNKYLEKIAKDANPQSKDLGIAIGGTFAAGAMGNVAELETSRILYRHKDRNPVMSDKAFERTKRFVSKSTGSTFDAGQAFPDFSPGDVKAFKRHLSRAAGPAYLDITHKKTPGLEGLKKSYIHLAEDTHLGSQKSVGLHEMGHAMDYRKGREFKAARTVYGKISGKGGPITGAISAGLLANEKTRDKAWIAPLALHAPTFASEVAANIHGAKLVKRFGDTKGGMKTFASVAGKNLLHYGSKPAIGAAALYGLGKYLNRDKKK